MKRCTFALVVLLSLTILSLGMDSDRKHVVLHPSATRNALPFSDAVEVGNTLYVAGTVGFDSVTGKPPTEAKDEAKLVMDHVKEVVESEGMSMDDLVSVQVFCTDVSLFDTFNSVYRTYFHNGFPARAFLGVASLVRGARFEVMVVAVKGAKQ